MPGTPVAIGLFRYSGPDGIESLASIKEWRDADHLPVVEGPHDRNTLLYPQTTALPRPDSRKQITTLSPASRYSSTSKA